MYNRFVVILGDCGVGERYDRASDSCLKCPVGTYQDVPLEVVCKDCPTWKTTLEEGSDEYDDCFGKINASCS